jgi:hypothetical protein
LKEEALDRTLWRTRFGRDSGPVVRQSTKWMYGMEQVTGPWCERVEPSPAFAHEVKNWTPFATYTQSWHASSSSIQFRSPESN